MFYCSTCDIAPSEYPHFIKSLHYGSRAHVSILINVHPSTGCAASLLRHSPDDPVPDAADIRKASISAGYHSTLQQRADRVGQEDGDWNKYISLN